jgi:hypothetical protein
MFRSLYSVHCLRVNVYCTAATGYQPNCSYILLLLLSLALQPSAGYGLLDHEVS